VLPRKRGWEIVIRRTVIGLVSTAALASLVGAGPRAQTPVELEIGYMPILPVSQLFVGLEHGWIEEAGIRAELVQFQNGPAMVQALLAGQLDVAHFGIGPAMVARAKGADIKVVASSIVEQISFIALDELAAYFESGDAGTAFARFAADKGRKAVVTTFPVGSVPETVLQFWLRHQIGADPSDVEIIYQGAAQVQQALLTGAVDAAAILEPIVTIVRNKVEGARVVAKGSEMFPHQPGAVLVVREGLIADHPDAVRALVDSHERATRLLNEQPAEAAVAVQKYVGGGRLDLALVEESIRQSGGHFVADPHFIVDGTKTMHDFQAALGTLKNEVAVDELFDTSFYDALER
jgi:NitT/TauT family transport system substrate-binding protein